MTAGVDEPDRRGRTGLHLTGLGLDRNPDVVVKDVELLASDWYVVRATTLDICGSDGTWRTVLPTRQFRYPVYVNGHPDGMLLEPPACLLDQDDPETAIRREAAEETGVTVGEVELVELSIDEAEAGIGSSMIVDAKTIMLLQWAVLSDPLARYAGSVAGASGIKKANTAANTAAMPHSAKISW